ncbi:hypothetical protein NL676_017601 [Syzygium grande]|nr:hypothetical protein NL676_017601 [Syzygium grande]
MSSTPSRTWYSLPISITKPLPSHHELKKADPPPLPRPPGSLSLSPNRRLASTASNPSRSKVMNLQRSQIERRVCGCLPQIGLDGRSRGGRERETNEDLDSNDREVGRRRVG